MLRVKASADCWRDLPHKKSKNPACTSLPSQVVLHHMRLTLFYHFPRMTSFIFLCPSLEQVGLLLFPSSRLGLWDTERWNKKLKSHIIVDLGKEFRLSTHKAWTNIITMNWSVFLSFRRNSMTHLEGTKTGAVGYSLTSLGGSSKGAPGCGINTSWANWNTNLLPGIALFLISQPECISHWWGFIF